MGTSNLLLTMHVFNDLAKKKFCYFRVKIQKKLFSELVRQRKKIEQINRNARLTSDKKRIDMFHESNNQTHFVICMWLWGKP